jgi:branched-chain amino acid transport system ATP-binding protein
VSAAPALEAVDLTSGYLPGQAVIKKLNLAVTAGQVTVLFGANGAGKTTTMHTLAGVMPATSGEVRINGVATKKPLHLRARDGLSYVTEQRSVLMGLTTRENLQVGGVSESEAFALFPELEKRIDVLGGLLSGGEQQMLTVARALGRKPRILLADELSLGLATKVVTRLLEAVRDAANNKGTAVLLVEQHVKKVLRYADFAYVLQRGEIVLSGSGEELATRIDEIESYYMYGVDSPG